MADVGGAQGRLAGVDLARALAVAGMMAVHLLPAGAGGFAGLAHDLSGGRASALFAVLAGVSLGLVARAGPSAAARAGLRAGIAARAVLVALLGLALVSVQGVIAVILPYYGLAFLVLLPVLWWPARRLAVLAGGWLLLAPVAGHLLRAGLPPGPGPQPTLAALADPVDLLTTLALTGYYPVLGWSGYLLLGLAVSRAGLRGAATPLRLVGVGAVLAGGAHLASALLLGPAGGAAALAAADPAGARLLGDPQAAFYGTTPTTSWWWLAVDEAHAGTPPDLLATAGAALVVLGAALALPAAVTRWLRPLTAVGAMPLTVYTAHVVAVGVLHTPEAWLLGVHLLAALVLATAWREAFGRGPLEELLATAAGGTSQLVQRVLHQLRSRPARDPLRR